MSLNLEKRSIKEKMEERDRQEKIKKYRALMSKLFSEISHNKLLYKNLYESERLRYIICNLKNLFTDENFLNKISDYLEAKENIFGWLGETWDLNKELFEVLDEGNEILDLSDIYRNFFEKDTIAPIYEFEIYLEKLIEKTFWKKHFLIEINVSVDEELQFLIYLKNKFKEKLKILIKNYKEFGFEDIELQENFWFLERE